MTFLYSPFIALFIYTIFVIILFLFGKKLAGKEHPSDEKSSIYGGGENAPMESSIPGYRPFILVAFFFALFHLAILILGTSTMQPTVIIYTIGIGLALVALMLG